MSILLYIMLVVMTAIMEAPADTSDAPPATRGEAIQVTPTLPPPAPPRPEIPEGAWKCPQWFDTAMDAGWPLRLWHEVDHVMWGESRCNPSLLTDWRSGPQFVNDYSFGLLQHNVKPGIGTQAMFAQFLGCPGPTGCDWSQMFDPYVNLRVGWDRYQFNLTASYTGGCGWWGWTVARKAGFC